MSVGPCIILVMSNFKSYWYVCQACDASIEVVSKGIHFQDPTCNCNNSEVVWCQTSVVESDPKQTKEEKMETNTEVPMTYDANVLVTYKDIINGIPTYPTIKVNDLEWKLERVKSLENQLSNSNSQIGKIIDNLTVEGWYNPNTDKDEVLRDICEILGHTPQQEMSWSVTVSVSGTTMVNLDEVEDFDIRYHLADNLSVDSNDFDTNVNSWDIDYVDSQDWQ